MIPGVGDLLAAGDDTVTRLPITLLFAQYLAATSHPMRPYLLLPPSKQCGHIRHTHVIVTEKACNIDLMLLRARCAVLLLGLLMCPAVFGQDDGVVRLKVETRVVQVAVSVKDAHSKPVPDLRKEDFTVLDEGKRREIALFSAEAESAAPPVRPPSLPLNVYSNRFGANASRGRVTRDSDRRCEHRLGRTVVCARAGDRGSRPDGAGRVDRAVHDESQPGDTSGLHYRSRAAAQGAGELLAGDPHADGPGPESYRRRYSATAAERDGECGHAAAGGGHAIVPATDCVAHGARRGA